MIERQQFVKQFADSLSAIPASAATSSLVKRTHGGQPHPNMRDMVGQKAHDTG
jgi:hypothetical protein